MSHSFSLLRRATLAAAVTLSLAACHRAEYAVLPKSPAYLGSAAVAPRPAAAPAPAAAVPNAEATPVATAPATLEPATVPVKLASRAPQVVAVSPAAPLRPQVAAPVVVAPAALPAPAVAAAPARPNLVQRLMLRRVSKQLGRLMARAPQLRQHDAAASTTRLDSSLRTGIILLAIGIIVALFGNAFTVIGTIIAIIGLVFILLWALDQA